MTDAVQGGARCSTSRCRPNGARNLASPRATATDIVPRMTTDPDGVAAVSWGPRPNDLFSVGADGGLVHRVREGDTWQEAESLGGTLTSPPAATAWDVDELQVFAIFPDGQLWNRYWDGSYWHDWETLGGELTGTPSASSWAADRIDVWAPGRDGTIWHRWWDGTRWVEWERLPAD